MKLSFVFLKKWISFVFFFLFFIAIVLFILFVPFKTKEPLAAIPDNAIFVSIHNNFFERLPFIFSNNLVRSFVEESHKISQETNNILASGEIQKWIKGLSWHTNKVVFAYTEHPPGWIIVSPLGNYSMLMQFYLLLRGYDFAIPVSRLYGYKIWKLKEKSTNQNEKKSIIFTIAEGMIIATFSENEHLLRKALLTLLGVVPSMNFVSNAMQEASAHYDDFGWIRYGKYKENVISFGMPLLTTNSLSLRLFLYNAIRKTEVSSNDTSNALNDKITLINFFGNKPFFVASIRMAELNNFLQKNLKDYFVLSHIVTNSLFTPPSDKLLIGLFSDTYAAYYGDFPFRLKFPVLVIGWEPTVLFFTQSVNLKEKISSIFDELNKLKKIGLVLDPMPVTFADGSFIYAIDVTSSPISKLLDKDARPAIASLNSRFLLFASHTGVLKRMMEEEAFRKAAIISSCKWGEIVSNDRNNLAACWFDLEKSSKELMFPLSLLRSFMKGENQKMITIIQRFLEALRSFKEGRIEVRSLSGNPFLEIAIDLGKN